MNSSAESGDDESEARRYRESLLKKMKRSSEAFVSMNPVSDQEPNFDEETQRLVDEILGKSPDDEKDPLDDEKMDEIVDKIWGKDRKVATPIENVNPDRGMSSRSAGRGFLAWGALEEPKPSVWGSGFGNYGSRANSRDEKSSSRSMGVSEDGETAANTSRIRLEEERERKEIERKQQERKKEEEVAAEKRRKIEKLRSKVSSQKQSVSEKNSRLIRLNEKIAAKQEKINGINDAMSMAEDSQQRSELGIKRADVESQLLSLKLKRIDVQGSLSDAKSRLEHSIRKLEVLSLDAL